MTEKRKVVMFGESGGGKSSAANIILGRRVAPVFDRAVGGTFDFQDYEAPNYIIYDTAGLSEGARGTVSHPAAINQLINLLKQIEDGVSLLIFVMEKGKIKKSLVENYKLFVEAICMGKVPVILLITHCEMDPEPDKWWRENKTYFDRYNMTFDAVVCGCTMNPETTHDSFQPVIKKLNDKTASQLRETIDDKMLVVGWKIKGGWMSWLQTILNNVLTRLSAWFGIPFNRFFSIGGETFEDRLYDYYLNVMGYDQLVARQMANNIANSRMQTAGLPPQE